MGLWDLDGSIGVGLAGKGRIVCKGSFSASWDEPDGSSKSSKLSSGLSIVPSSEANAFNLSDESMPPKLSCGRR